MDFELPDGFKVDFEVLTDFVDGTGLELFVAEFGFMSIFGLLFDTFC